MTSSSLQLQPPPHCRRRYHHHHSFSSTAIFVLPNLPFPLIVHSHKALPYPLSPKAPTLSLTFTSSSPPTDFLRRLSISSLFFLGVSLCAFSAASASTSTPTTPPPQQQQQIQDLQKMSDEQFRELFEKWKSKTYALTVPIRVVTVRNSVPPAWFKHFLESQGKRVKLHADFRQSLQNIFHELTLPFSRGKISQQSALAADVVSLGDSWLGVAISKGIVEPMLGAEEEDWFRHLSEKWKVYLRRSSKGKLDSQGKIWAAPYRWGSMVIAYKKGEFQNRNLAPVEDWDDLWRPELAGRITMVDSTREVIGLVLKSMGASYNTENINFQVSGGRKAVQQKLEHLVKQVRLFDSLHYLKAFALEDVWVAVGWSSDILPAAKRMSSVSVIVPKCGASLWADFWVVPAASRIESDQIGGRRRGPSPLVYQWIEFCLQPNRALQFKEEAIPGASPIALESPAKKSEEEKKSISKLETDLIASVPPEILERCEFLEPLSDDAMADYKRLVSCVEKPRHGILQRAYYSIMTLIHNFQHILQSKVAGEPKH